LILLGTDQSEFNIDLLRKGTLINSKSLHAEVKSKELQAHHPIVLVCTDGKQSLKSAESLIKDGYINVFIIKGGVKGLIQEIAIDQEESRGEIL
jgi:rhodanese-related sulfurtransferase